MKKIFISLFIVFSTACIVSVHSIYAAAIPQKAINIVLDHTNPTAPTVISVAIKDTNPEEYKLSLLDHFFMIREVDANGSILFAGEVKRYKLAGATNESLDFTEVPENPVIMDIPYHQEAQKVLIFDEVGNLLLEIDLGLYSIGPTPTPAPRYAECNKCGFCKNRTAPSDLNQCMKCIYPDYVNNPEGTLMVDTRTNKAVEPRTGAYYSQLGCIDVGLGGFRDSSAAGGVLNVILSRLIFPVAGILSLLSLVYGSFLLMTAQGNVEQLGRGKRWIYGAIVGVIFTFGTVLIVRIIGGDILRIPGLDT